MTIETTQLDNTPACPVCRSLLDGATGDGRPKPDDLTVCVYCGVFLSFTASMDLRVLDAHEFAALPAEARDQLTQYLNITRGLRRRQPEQ